MKKQIFLIMALTILAKLTGFIREVVLSYYYGASFISDAFLISMTIPGVIFSFLGAGISTGYIPMYNKVISEEGVEKANDFTSNLLNFEIILCHIITILVLIFTEPIVKLFAIGFRGETLRYAIEFTRISIVGIYFTSIVYIFIGYLQINNNFKIPQLISLPSNLCWVIGIYIASKYNNLFLAYAGVAATGVQVIFLIPWVLKKNYNYKFKINFKDKYIKKMIYLSIPLIMGVSVNQLNTLIDKNIASLLEEGGITALNYASKLNVVIIGVFCTSVTTVLYPKISQMVIKQDKKGIIDSLNESIIIINIIVIPIMLGSMMFSEELIKILFGRGAFSEESIKKTGEALFYYSIGMLGFGLREILARVFYAYQDNKTPMINAAIGVGLNIILNIILSKYMGISGLAFATSISAIVTALMMGYTLRKKIGSFGIKELVITTLKITFSSLLMGLGAKIIFSYLTLKLNGNISLIISVGIGAVIYIVTISLMKIKDVDILLSLIKNKISKN